MVYLRSFLSLYLTLSLPPPTLSLSLSGLSSRRVHHSWRNVCSPPLPRSQASKAELKKNAKRKKQPRDAPRRRTGYMVNGSNPTSARNEGALFARELSVSGWREPSYSKHSSNLIQGFTRAAQYVLLAGLTLSLLPRENFQRTDFNGLHICFTEYRIGF